MFALKNFWFNLRNHYIPRSVGCVKTETKVSETWFGRRHTWTWLICTSHVWQLLYLQHWCIWCADIARTRKKIVCNLIDRKLPQFEYELREKSAGILVNSVEQPEALFIHSFHFSFHMHIYSNTYKNVSLLLLKIITWVFISFLSILLAGNWQTTKFTPLKRMPSKISSRWNDCKYLSFQNFHALLVYFVLVCFLFFFLCTLYLHWWLMIWIGAKPLNIRFKL